MATLIAESAANADDWGIGDLSVDANFTVGGVSTSPLAGHGQGWRFPDCSELAGATINSAVMSLMKNGNQWSDQSDRWTAIDEDATAQFSASSPTRPGDRPIVSASIAAQSLNVNQLDATRYSLPTTSTLQETLGAAVQAVIDRSGWTAVIGIVNNSDQDASAVENFMRKNWYSFEGGSGNEPQLVVDYTAGSGTLYEQAVSGSLGLAGSLGKQDAKSTVGTLPLAGTVSKQTQRGLSGALGLAGTLAGARILVANLVGALGLSGALSKQPEKQTGGTLPTSGSLTKSPGKTLSGTLGLSGVVSAIRALFISLTGTLGLSGALSKQAKKDTAGTLPLAGTVSKQAQRSLSGTLGLSGVVSAIRALFISLTGTLGLSGALSKQAEKDTAGTLSLSGSISKRISKLLSGLVGFIGDLLASGGVTAGPPILDRPMTINLETAPAALDATVVLMEANTVDPMPVNLEVHAMTVSPAIKVMSGE